MSRHNGLNPESIHFYIYEEDSKGNSRKNSSSSFFDSAINGADARARSFADVICTCSCWSSISLFVVAIHFVFSWLDCIECIFLASIIPERTRWSQSAVEKVFVLCFDVATKYKEQQQPNERQGIPNPSASRIDFQNKWLLYYGCVKCERPSRSISSMSKDAPATTPFFSLFSLCVFFV